MRLGSSTCGGPTIFRTLAKRAHEIRLSQLLNPAALSTTNLTRLIYSHKSLHKPTKWVASQSKMLRYMHPWSRALSQKIGTDMATPQAQKFITSYAAFLKRQGKLPMYVLHSYLSVKLMENPQSQC